MARVLFYHLTASAAAETARGLLARACQQGWRVMVRGTDRAALEALDAALWLGPDEGFLPHGLQGGPHDAGQPILLGTGAIGNGAQALMLVDGATTDAAEAACLDRVWILFDGTDEAAVAAARAQWTALTAGGQAAEYWSEESGRWAKRA